MIYCSFEERTRIAPIPEESMKRTQRLPGAVYPREAAA
jgi:hypothetical protein